MQIVSQVASVSYSHFPARLALPPPPERLRLNAPPALLMLPAPRIEVQQRSTTHVPTYHADLMAALGPIRSREAMNAELTEMASDALRDLWTMRAQIAETLASKGRRS